MSVSESLHRIASHIGILAWASSLTVVVACLMVGHWVSLPHPKNGTQLQIPTSQIAFPFKFSTECSSPLLVFHFLYADCPCSRKVLNHLIQRGPVKDVPELLVLVDGGEKQSRLAAQAGFHYFATTPQKLKSQFGIEAAPLLVATDRNGKIRYSGGYTSRKQGLDYVDVQVIHDLLQNKPVVEHPVFGCGVSDGLKDLVDPLRLKTLTAD